MGTIDVGILSRSGKTYALTAGRGFLVEKTKSIYRNRSYTTQQDFSGIFGGFKGPFGISWHHWNPNKHSIASDVTVTNYAYTSLSISNNSTKTYSYNNESITYNQYQKKYMVQHNHAEIPYSLPMGNDFVCFIYSDQYHLVNRVNEQGEKEYFYYKNTTDYSEPVYCSIIYSGMSTMYEFFDCNKSYYTARDNYGNLIRVYVFATGDSAIGGIPHGDFKYDDYSNGLRKIPDVSLSTGRFQIVSRVYYGHDRKTSGTLTDTSKIGSFPVNSLMVYGFDPLEYNIQYWPVLEIEVYSVDKNKKTISEIQEYIDQNLVAPVWITDCVNLENNVVYDKYDYTRYAISPDIQQFTYMDNNISKTINITDDTQPISVVEKSNLKNNEIKIKTINGVLILDDNGDYVENEFVDISSLSIDWFSLNNTPTNSDKKIANVFLKSKYGHQIQTVSIFATAFKNGEVFNSGSYQFDIFNTQLNETINLYDLFNGTNSNVNETNIYNFVNTYYIDIIVGECEKYNITICKGNDVNNKESPDYGTVEVKYENDVILSEINNQINGDLYIDNIYLLKAIINNNNENEFAGWYKAIDFDNNLNPIEWSPIEGESSDNTPLYLQNEIYYTQSNQEETYVKAVFKQRPRYGLFTRFIDNNGNEIEDCAIEIINSSLQADENQMYISGTQIAFSVNLIEGYEVVNCVKINTSGVSNSEVINKNEDESYSFIINSDVQIDIVIKKINVSITLNQLCSSKYLSLSMRAIGDADVNNLTYGDFVLLTAQRGDVYNSLAVNDNWWFNGFSVDYNENFTHGYSADNKSYSIVYQIKNSIEITANACVKFSVHDNKGTGFQEWDLSIVKQNNGTTHIENGISGVNGGEEYAIVAIGADVLIEATPDEGYYFNGWFKTPYSQSYDNVLIPLNIASSQNITVDEDFINSNNTNEIPYEISLCAVFSSTPLINYIKIVNKNYNTSLIDNSLSDITFVESAMSNGDIVEITKDEYDLALSTGFSQDIETSVGDYNTGIKYYKIIGICIIDLSVSQKTNIGFMKWSVDYYYNDNGDIKLQSYNDNYDTNTNTQIISNKNFVITAVWGKIEPVKIIIETEVSSIAKGTQEFSNATLNHVSIANKSSAFYMPGDEAICCAVSRNGYRFIGWFNNPDCTGNPISTKQTYKFIVSNSMYLWAKFDNDSASIYKWEGSSENKEIKYRSRRYVFEQPIAFNSIRLYSESYEHPIVVKLFGSQSPDDKTVRNIERIIKTQEALRLPMCSPNKYYEIEIVGKSPITNLAISTSMGGLWQR